MSEEKSDQPLRHLRRLLGYLQGEVCREVVQLELQLRSIAQLFAEKRRQLDEAFAAVARRLEESRRAIEAETASAVAAALRRVRAAQEVATGHSATAGELRRRLGAWGDGGWSLPQLCSGIMALKEQFSRAPRPDAAAQLFAPDWPWPQVSDALAELCRQLPGADLSSGSSFNTSGLPDAAG